MSGGSYNYTYSRVDEEYSGRMYDVELDEMVRDLVPLLRALEWWQSGDYREDDYREEVTKFKEKWFGPRDERLHDIIVNECANLEKKLLQMIGKDKSFPQQKSILNDKAILRRKAPSGAILYDAYAEAEEILTKMIALHKDSQKVSVATYMELSCVAIGDAGYGMIGWPNGFDGVNIIREARYNGKFYIDLPAPTALYA